MTTYSATTLTSTVRHIVNPVGDRIITVSLCGEVLVIPKYWQQWGEPYETTCPKCEQRQREMRVTHVDGRMRF